MDHAKVRPVRPAQRTPRADVAPPPVSVGIDQKIEDRAEILALQRCSLRFAFQRQVRLREMPLGPRIDRRLQLRQHQRAVHRDLGARLREARLDRIRPGRVHMPALQQRVALRQCLLVARRGAAMRRLVRHHQPVEEPPPVRRAAPEHAVHRRRQPDQPHPFRQVARARRRAVDANRPFGRARAFQCDADLLLAVQHARNRPATGCAVPRHLCQLRRPQAAPRPELADRFQQVRLARAVRAIETHRPPIEHQREARIVPEVREGEAGKGGHSSSRTCLAGRCCSPGIGSPGLSAKARNHSPGRGSRNRLFAGQLRR